ncbi:DNA repair protein RecN, partial [Microcoleus sp. herbarium8]
EALELAYQIALDQLKEACSHLTILRREAALKLETHLVGELKPLAMEKVQFQVAISPCSPTASGADQIAFCFSPNPGEPLQPLGAIASGGEMSRFLLAIKACFSQIESAGTLIFDEIDAGVSGRVAGAIAKKLHQLSDKHQVLCVTHQPLIAAMADCHFRVNKMTIAAEQNIDEAANSNSQLGERTVVRVVGLNSQQRREELAQLASGRSATEAIAFAESLLVEAAGLRQIQSAKP